MQATVYVLRSEKGYWANGVGWVGLESAATFPSQEDAKRSGKLLRKVTAAKFMVEIVKCTLTESVPPEKEPSSPVEGWVESQKEPL